MEGQESLFGHGSPCGRTSPALSRPASRKGRTSGSSSKNSPASPTQPPLFLDLRKGSGNLLGSYWETDGASPGVSWTRNTGECPSAAVESRLSAILEANPHSRYYLSAKACRGIMRRAERRGKAQPPILERALLWQISWMERGLTIARTLITRQDGTPCVDRGSEIVVTPYDTTQITSKANRSNPAPGAPCHTLNAQAHTPLIVASGFKAGQGDAAGGIGFAEETAPTIGGTASGLNQVPAVLACRTGHTGANGHGVAEDVAHTLDGANAQAVCCDARGNDDGLVCMASGQANAEILQDRSPTLNCDHEQPIIMDCRHDRLEEISGTLVAKGSGGNGVQDNNPVIQGAIVRRLTPLECERLQGHPDGWTDIPEITDISDEGYELFKRLLFDAAVREKKVRQNPAGVWEVWRNQHYEVRRGGAFSHWATVWKNTGRPYEHKSRPAMIAYINGLKSDSARYKALGNSIALPPWRWVLGRVAALCGPGATLGSLFDGIGGFPLIWEEINGRGSCRWASEIEPFCVAVTMYHFGGEYSSVQ